MDKPKIEDIKYIGSWMGKSVWGDSRVEEIVKYYTNALEKEWEKNMNLEVENFRLSVKRPSFFERLWLN